VRVPERNHEVTGNGCEAVNKRLWSHRWLWGQNQIKQWSHMAGDAL